MCEQELEKSRRRVHDAVYQRLCGSEFYKLLLAELKLESCELVGLPATSIRQQATESKGESNVITSRNIERIGLTVYVYGIHRGISQAQAGASSKHKAYRASWPADCLERVRAAMTYLQSRREWDLHVVSPKPRLARTGHPGTALGESQQIELTLRNATSTAHHAWIPQYKTVCNGGLR